MLSESLRVPYRADDAFGTILVGSVLSLLTGVLVAVWAVLLAVWPRIGFAVTPVVALPSLVIRGYLLEVVEGGITNESTVPSFVKWGALVRTGSKSVLVSVLYLLPGAVLCGLVVGAGVTAEASLSAFDETAQALTGLLVLIAGVGLLIYALVYLYVRPAAQAVLAVTGSLRAIVRVRRVLRLAASGDYLSGWLIASGLLVVGPTLLLPPLVVAVLVGLLSPPLAAVIVLVTLFLGIGFAFVFRVSAAWSIGRGAASRIDLLYPAANEPDSTADDSRIVLKRQTTPKLDGGSAEVDPMVQTGRTVEASRIERSTGDAADPESIPNGAADREPAPADSTEPRSLVNGDDGDDEDNEDDDSGFVWGLNDNESQ